LTNAGTYQLLFPAQYSGPVSVKITMTPVPSAAATLYFIGNPVTDSNSAGGSIVKTGNVVPLYDIYAPSPNVPVSSSTFPNYRIYTTPAGLTYTQGAGNCGYAQVSEFHYYVTTATQGMNNAVFFTFQSTGVGSGNVVYAIDCVVSQYQTNGITTSSARPSFVNTSNTVVTPS